MTCDSPQVPADDQVLLSTVATLRAAGCVYAEDEAALLLAAPGDVDALVARRVAGEPLEQVLGWAEFAGLRIGVRPGVFVPRRRTELLAAEAVARLAGARIAVDLCCGAGAVAAVVVAARPDLEVHAADVDPVAVGCARENLPTAVVSEGDLLDALDPGLRGRIDLLVANTPYVPSEEIAFLPPEARDHEPGHTLDGGPDGLGFLRRIAADAGSWLSPGGWLLIEISERQLVEARTVLAAAGLAVSSATDADLGACVVIGRRPLPNAPADARLGR